MSGERRESKRIVKLFCPALSKVVPFAAWDEQRLDLGSIALTFGLDPATLKLNGHFISRGVDLLASSVTWKSLLSFFSARGFSTGAHDADALIVDGKLCKAGTKRAYNPADEDNGTYSIIKCEDASASGNLELEDTNLLKKKKLQEGNSGFEDGGNQIIRCDGTGLKRKQWLEDFSPCKRLRMNETNTDFEEVRMTFPAPS